MPVERDVPGQNVVPRVTRGTDSDGFPYTVTHSPSTPMRSVLCAFAALVVLAGCSGTFDEVFNRPDSLDWTYFEGTPQEVVVAIQEAYAFSSLRVESVETDEDLGGTIVTLTPRTGSADMSQILVQATTVEGFKSRAQFWPSRDPLPRALEIEISGRV